MPEELSANDQLRLAANRRSVNGSMNDMAASFDRMGLAQSAAAKAQQQHQQHSGQSPLRGPTSASAGPIRAAGAAGMFGAPASGQHSLLQRAMGQPQQVQQAAQQHQQSGMNPGEGNLTPVFNERFLFSDDELEADDSTFVKKYNLNEDDNSFPVLIRHDSHPGMVRCASNRLSHRFLSSQPLTFFSPHQLSASSAALDLAPLSQTPPRFPRGDANASEWPQFVNRDGPEPGMQQANAGSGGPPHGGAESFDRFGARRGRSERNSPRMSGQGPRGNHLTTAPVTPVSMGRSNDSSLPRSATGTHFGPGPRPGNGHPLSQGYHDRSTDDGPHKDHARAGRNQDAGKVESSFAPFAMGGFSGDVKRSGSGLTTPGRFPSSYGFDNRGPGGDPSSRSSSGYFDAFAAPPVSKTPAGQKPGGAGLGSAYGLGPDSGNQLNSASAGAAGLNGVKVPRKGELDTSTPLEDLQGEIFALCKDQHGCRYLQKKLEEGNPAYRDMIFTETFSHFAELMTDPFGNYLCQKMLEYCTDDQRNLIVESVAPDLVGISLNMHGTRAVQKTIDFLSTPRQIHSIIMALGMNVVPLIKDLNGNHVIQKCLNRLGSTDNQFIYDAVATHCVEVATHRHGCCVLQRCIDHASENQRMQLVQEITFHALTLVQDPFGNYVVQYILDLNDARYSDALVRQFLGHVCHLSVQKFSSNVIEKCIRVSEPGLRKLLIEELLNRTRLEKLLRDSFANYVVQTSLDYADPVQRMQLVECIKPILPMIRNTPYGKRIQSKLQRDNIDLGPSPGNVPYGLLQAAHQQQLQAMAAMAHRQGPGGSDFGAAGVGNLTGSPYGTNFNPAAAPGNPRNFGRQGMSHMPPHAMYGAASGSGAGRGGPYGQSAGGVFGAGGGSASGLGSPAAGPGASPGNGAAAGYGRPHNMGFAAPQQAPFAMHNGFAAAGVPSHPANAGPFHGGQFGGQF